MYLSCNNGSFMMLTWLWSTQNRQVTVSYAVNWFINFSPVILSPLHLTPYLIPYELQKYCCMARFFFLFQLAIVIASIDSFYEQLWPNLLSIFPYHYQDSLGQFAYFFYSFYYFSGSCELTVLAYIYITVFIFCGKPKMHYSSEMLYIWNFFSVTVIMTNMTCIKLRQLFFYLSSFFSLSFYEAILI